MQILHISAECFPAAKAGGLGDVVGALPKYLNRAGYSASVVIPKYATEWIQSADTEEVYRGEAPWHLERFPFSVERVLGPDIGFPLYVIDIADKFDRQGIYNDPWTGYPYWDEMERFFSFQIAAVEWAAHLEEKPSVIHTHDHHTALVPFLMTQCYRYRKLASIPTILTIHNGEYQGRYDRHNYTYLPAFDIESVGLLDWDGQLNALAAGIKCAWQVTTVSEGYLGELMNFCHGLEHLLRMEKQKMTGILNGIDVEVWNPETDPMIEKNYTVRGRKGGKRANKEALCREFGLDRSRPLFSFIGRLVGEKGADLLPELIESVRAGGIEATFLVLGTGERFLHQQLSELSGEYTGFFDARLEYNEALAHTIYAGSDFLLMPSRVEPCGLNQMYAMRYGTTPVVRAVGGLADTVVDLSRPGGYGFLFEDYSIAAAMESIQRAVDYYQRGEYLENMKRLMKLDFSWERSSGNYIELYSSLIKRSDTS